MTKAGLTWAFSLLLGTGFAEVSVPALFGEHMVLQQQTHNAVWGFAEAGENVFPDVLDAVKACATEGEVMGALRDVYGEYTDPGVF